MSDGYIGLFRNNVPILSNEPTIEIVEELERSKKAYVSNARITCSGVNILQGTIAFLKVERLIGAVPAVTHLFGIRNVEVDHSIDIGDGTDVYTFTDDPEDSGSNRVLIGTTMSESMSNLYKAINGSGNLEGVFRNVTEASTCKANWITEGCVLLVSKEEGSLGNSVQVRTSDPEKIAVSSPALEEEEGEFVSGEDELEDALGISTFSVDWGPGINSGVYIVPNVPFSDEGIYHKFNITFFNEKNNAAVLLGETSPYVYSSTLEFNGKEIEQPGIIGEYAPVLNLMCMSADQVYGGSEGSPTFLPRSGIARLTWSNMSTFSRGLNGYPVAKKKIDNTQDAVDLSAKQMKNIKEYSIFMYVPLNNTTTAPLYDFPNNEETNGSWVLCGRTTATHFDISPPIDMVVSFWVGFGTSDTISNTSMSIANKGSTYNNEQYYPETINVITDDTGTTITDDLGDVITDG